MEDKAYWHVSYNYSNSTGSGFGSIEITQTSDVFVPSEIRDWIKSTYSFNNVVLLNWKPLQENQLRVNNLETEDDIQSR